MKKLNLLLFVLFLSGGLLLGSCKDDDPEVTINLSVTPGDLTFEANATEAQSVTVTTNAENYTPTPEETWVHVTKTAKGFDVTVDQYTEAMAEANENKARETVIKVSATGTSTVREVKVTQKAPGDGPDPEYTIEVDVEEVRYDVDGTLHGDPVTVTTDAPAIIVTIPSASQAMITEGKVEGGKLVLTLSENETEDVRTGTVVLTAEYSDDEITIEVLQAMPEIYNLIGGDWGSSNLWVYNSSSNSFGVHWASGPFSFDCTWDGFDKFYVIEHNQASEQAAAFIYRIDVDTSVAVVPDDNGNVSNLKGRFYFEKGKSLGVTRNGQELFNEGIIWDDTEKEFIALSDGERIDLLYTHSASNGRNTISLLSQNFEYKGETSRYIAAFYAVDSNDAKVYDAIVGNVALSAVPPSEE